MNCSGWTVSAAGVSNRSAARGITLPIAAALAFLGTLLLSASASLGQSPEVRAMWVSRFEWPFADEATCKARIDTIMQDLADANFNAVFFQVRGQADVLYPSPDEVWSPLIGGNDPGWDPLAYAISAAHSRGIAFHAYINTHTCWQSVPASAHGMPGNPNHVLYEHCNATDPAHRDWLHYNTPTNPVQFSESDYVWFSPGVPAYQAYVRKQILHVVTNYDVDGVHYDRIRTPWSDQVSYDPISVARHADAQSNPDGLTFSPWTTDQINRTVRDIYAQISAVKPQVLTSAAVYSNPATAPSAQHQDAMVWAQTGGLDILVPMMYFSGGNGSTWDSRLQTWIAGSGGRHVVAGHITSQGSASLLEQIALSRLRGAQGNNVFSWSSFSWWTDYVNDVYPTAVARPAIPWKDSPTTGIIQGYVSATDASPVVDVQITRNGSTYTALSSGDGYYSFLLVPPGAYTLTASKPGYPGAVVGSVNVAAGDIVRQDIVIGAPLPPVIAEVSPDPDAATVGEIYSRQLSLAQGSADSWTLMTGPTGADVNDAGFVTGWTPEPEDVGQLTNFTVRATNSQGSDDESWQVQVAAPPPCETYTIADFDGYPSGASVLFQLPRYSGSTSEHLFNSPNMAYVSTEVDAYSPEGVNEVVWSFLDADPQRWMRLTTHNVANGGNPTIALDRPIRVHIRLDAGRLRLCVGVRETGTLAEIGQDGGSGGTIEWIGATGDIDGAPQGVLVEADPGVWQTFVFDPTTDPIYPMTGDGVLFSATGKGVFEQLAFSMVDYVGPVTVYLDDIELLCAVPAFGDLDGDGDADLDDLSILLGCMQGPEVIVAGACLAADADGDNDVDLADASAFLTNHTGSY